MAWRIDKTESGRDIVLDGFEKGIGRSPHAGIERIENLDVIGVPGQASVAYKTAALNKPPTVSAVAFTCVAATDLITVADTTGWYNGMAIQFNSVVTSTGISTGRVFWVGDLSGNTFKVYKNPSRHASQVVDIATGDGSGTLSSYTFGKPIDDTTGHNANSDGTRNYYFILDENGRAWWVDNTGGTVTNNLVYLGNDTLTGTTGRAIEFWKNHILVFRSTTLDGLSTWAIEDDEDLDAAYSGINSGGWSYGFVSVASHPNTPRPTFVGQDDVVYWGSTSSARVSSLTETAGDVFECNDSGSYTRTSTALDIPDNDEVNSLGELGQYLLVGGILNKIYPWDRSSSSFDFPLIVPEKKTAYIVSSNSIAYIFAGTGSRIYQTNGVAVGLFYEIPDHLSGVGRPYFTLHDAEIDKNQLYFSFSATENDGSTAVTGTDGVWAIDLTTLVLRKVLTTSHGTEGKALLIAKNELTSTPPGEGFFVAWQDASSNYGVDTGSNDPYDGGEAFIDFDQIPVGTLDFNTTPSMFEFKLQRPLVSGESIQLLVRTDLSGSYTSLGTTNTAGLISDKFKPVVKQAEWLQIRAILTSTATSPSYVPLREIRIKI